MEKQKNTHDLPDPSRLAYLIFQYIRQELTRAERMELGQWLVKAEENIALFEELTDEAYLKRGLMEYIRIRKSEILN